MGSRSGVVWIMQAIRASPCQWRNRSASIALRAWGKHTYRALLHGDSERTFIRESWFFFILMIFYVCLYEIYTSVHIRTFPLLCVARKKVNGQQRANISLGGYINNTTIVSHSFTEQKSFLIFKSQQTPKPGGSYPRFWVHRINDYELNFWRSQVQFWLLLRTKDTTRRRASAMQSQTSLVYKSKVNETKKAKNYDKHELLGQCIISKAIISIS